MTQTHLAEIQVLLKLEKEAKETGKNKPKIEEPSPDAQNEESGLSVYSEYIGKKIRRRRDGMVGIIKALRGENVVIDVIEGAKEGQEIEVQVDYLLSARGIYEIEG